MRIFFLLVILIFGFSSNSQTIDEFERVLIEKYPNKETISEEDWIYYKDENSIAEIDLEIYSDKKFKTYLVKMYTMVCFNFEEIDCVFTFDKENNEIKFVPEIWYSGLKEEFYSNIIGNELKNKKQINNFIHDFEELLKINNPDLRIENIYYEEGRTIFLLTHLLPNTAESSIRNILVLYHFKGKLNKINVLNPANNHFYTIE